MSSFQEMRARLAFYDSHKESGLHSDELSAIYSHWQKNWFKNLKLTKDDYVLEYKKFIEENSQYSREELLVLFKNFNKLKSASSSNANSGLLSMIRERSAPSQQEEPKQTAPSLSKSLEAYKKNIEDQMNINHINSITLFFQQMEMLRDVEKRKDRGYER